MKTQPVMRPLKRRPSSPLSDVTCFEELAKIISDESDTDDSTPDSGNFYKNWNDHGQDSNLQQRIHIQPWKPER